MHFKVRSRKELVRRGSSALLRCQALGDLPISLSWRKEGSFVELQGRIRYIKKKIVFLLNCKYVEVKFLSESVLMKYFFYLLS